MLVLPKEMPLFSPFRYEGQNEIYIIIGYSNRTGMIVPTFLVINKKGEVHCNVELDNELVERCYDYKFIIKSILKDKTKWYKNPEERVAFDLAYGRDRKYA